MKERDSRIELARIFAMLLVVVMHINTQGGVSEALVPMSLNYIVEWILLSVTYCAVDLFAIKSGYVGSSKENFQYSRALNLWLGVAFYTILITVGFAIFSPDSVRPIDFLKAITPASTGSYWFFSAYFAMFFFMPFMNFLLNKLDDKQIKALGITIVVIFSIVPTMRHSDPFVTDGGYSTIWLMSLYMIGGIIKRFKLLEKKSCGYYLRMFLFNWFIVWGSKILFEYVFIQLSGEAKGGGLLLSYVSPFVLMMTVAILGFFKNLKEPKRRGIRNGICSVSATTFSAYIIHEQPFIKHRFIIDRFAGYADKNVVLMLIYVLTTAIVIFGICALIDQVRIRLFKVLHAKEKSERLCSILAEKIPIRYNEIH